MARPIWTPVCCVPTALAPGTHAQAERIQVFGAGVDLPGGRDDEHTGQAGARVHGIGQGAEPRSPH